MMKTIITMRNEQLIAALVGSDMAHEANDSSKTLTFWARRKINYQPTTSNKTKQIPQKKILFIFVLLIYYTHVFPKNGMVVDRYENL